MPREPGVPAWKRVNMHEVHGVDSVIEDSLLYGTQYISNNVLINHPEQLHPLDMPEKPSMPSYSSARTALQISVTSDVTQKGASR